MINLEKKQMFLNNILMLNKKLSDEINKRKEDLKKEKKEKTATKEEIADENFEL